jgi:hypothetical protein
MGVFLWAVIPLSLVFMVDCYGLYGPWDRYPVETTRIEKPLEEPWSGPPYEFLLEDSKPVQRSRGLLTPNEFGDSFGALNSLFTALAFWGMLLAIYYQRQDLKVQREDLELQRMEFRKQLRETKDQTVLIRETLDNDEIYQCEQRLKISEAALEGLYPNMAVTGIKNRVSSKGLSAVLSALFLDFGQLLSSGSGEQGVLNTLKGNVNRGIFFDSFATQFFNCIVACKNHESVFQGFKSRFWSRLVDPQFEVGLATLLGCIDNKHKEHLFVRLAGKGFFPNLSDQEREALVQWFCIPEVVLRKMNRS